ncbi:MAG: Ig-like domain-containing protein [Candidatus Eisenbacteria bacterium]|nr:Ig-like domain-containing protein [Candidatus Eisenbacteria bacterium]
MRRLIPILLIAAAAPLFAATPSPEDWRNQTIYQIVTDRFFDGDPSNNAVEGNYDPADGYKIHGGDWSGIEQKLDYIRGMGVTALWISPVQQNAWAEYHGYSIKDFRTMAPHFGGMADLRSLIDALHARGMYAILDVIANHGGDLVDSNDPSYPDFHYPGDYTLRWRSPTNRPAPPFDNLSWYHNNGQTQDWVDPDQILGELWGLDDYKTEEPAVRDALIDAHTWLIDTTDADGFRIDTVKHVEFDFWQEWGPAIRAYADSIGKEDFFQFGEIFDGSSWNNGRYTGTQAGGPFALESTLWYPMYFGARWVFRDGGATEVLSGVYADSVYYDPTARNRLVTFIANHDNARFMGYGSNADHDEAKAKLAQAWMHTSLGVPCVYYGAEQEYDGGGDPYCREDMWDGAWDFGPSEGDHFDQTTPLYRWIRRLNGLRRDFPALRLGAQSEKASASDAGLYAYERILPGETTVLVAFNTKEKADTLVIDPSLPGGVVYDLLSDRSFTIPAGGTTDIVVGGLSAIALAAEAPDPAPWIETVWPPHDGVLPAPGAPIRILFDREMDRSSVEANLALTPSFACSAAWFGRTLFLYPESDLSVGQTYAVSVGAGARATNGDSLGAAFSFFFAVSSAGGGAITVPAEYAVLTQGDGDLDRPISLERVADGNPRAGRLLLGDTGWDRVYLWHDRGFVETVLADSLLGRPDALASDGPAGAFGGDLLVADPAALLRFRMEGAAAGRLERLASWPESGGYWTVAVDRGGAFGGRVAMGHPNGGSVWTADSNGAVSLLASGLGSVTGLAFGEGGDFGRDLYAVDGAGTIYRIDSTGAKTILANDPSLLGGATSPALDHLGGFGRFLYVVNVDDQTIVRVEPGGGTSLFASGFSGFEGGDALAFDGWGDLVAVESGASGEKRITRIVSLLAETELPGDPDPPARYGFLLGPNRPNPFNPSTRIPFSLAEAGRAELTVHDLRGRLTAVLFDGDLDAGPHEAIWDGTNRSGDDAPSGLYFVRLRSGVRSDARRVLLLR